MRIRRVSCLVAAVAILAGGPAAATAADAPGLAGPTRITGDFTYTNDLATAYYSEPASALVDMHGFITRDESWPIPLEGQILGPLTIDAEAKTGSYSIDLPVHPRATLNDVDHNAVADTGLEIFAATYWPNLVDGPYSEANDPSFGWPDYLASVKTDSENHNEVTGGKLVVWAPDDGQRFPAGFGADGRLFTSDDPIRTMPAGWSVVDLDSPTFTVSVATSQALTLYEPAESAIKDYSDLGYTAAYAALFTSVSTNWAFNDIPSKHVNWAALDAIARPRVAAAEKAKDPAAFEAALADFINAIPDGHSGIFGDLDDAAFARRTAAGYAFSMVPVDGGRFVVLYVSPGGPAEKAGIRVGAVVTKFNGKPIKAAVAAVRPPLTASEPAYLMYQQARYLLRAPVGTKASVTFTNPGAKSRTVSIRAIAETDSLRRTSLYRDAPEATSPVEFRYLDSGAGYIRINTNFDDLGLIIREFRYALAQFQLNGIANLIIDMRYNSGGTNLGLAGYLGDGVIEMGQLEYYSDETHRFEPEGPREQVLPNEPQYDFDAIAVLVGPACASACELEAYGFAKLPNALVVGMAPSAGIEAEVSRGQYVLPEGIGIQIPTGRFTNPDGSLFLEGVGVVPTVKVPVTLANLLSDEDVVLATAEKAVAAAGR